MSDPVDAEALRHDDTMGLDEPDWQPPGAVIKHSAPALDNEFEITVPKPGEPWHGTNGRVGITVHPDLTSEIPNSKHLADGEPWRMWKANAIKNACTPKAHKVQWLVAELNGVFVHVHDDGGLISIVVSAERLNP